MSSPPAQRTPASRPTRVNVWTAAALAAMLGVNLAGLAGIAVARRGAQDEAQRAFDAQVAERARAFEAALAGMRRDLEFLAHSTLTELGWRRNGAGRRSGAEDALLLYLRSHAPIVRVQARRDDGQVLLQAAWRGGLPIVWAAGGTTPVTAAPGPARLVTRQRVESGVADDRARITLETEVDPLALLRALSEPQHYACDLRVGSGAEVVSGSTDDQPVLRSSATIRADDWQPAAPWRLHCARPSAEALELVAPVVARYRATTALNLVGMALALFLGGLALQQARRRERLEAAAREEARVRELERRLFHAERLSTVGRLAAGIAHEINNPLEGMANYLTLACDDAARGDTSATLRRLAAVKEGFARVTNVVRRVLTMADPGRAPLRPLDLNRVLRESGQFLAARPEFAHVAVTLDLDDAPLMVRGDEVLLGQVALNLMLNACEAQPGAGELLVRARAAAPLALAEFADRGPGIPVEQRARVFEPFVSNKNSTGLGLAICESIVRRHAGELGVASRPGGGSIFCLRLPLASEAGA